MKGPATTPGFGNSTVLLNGIGAAPADATQPSARLIHFAQRAAAEFTAPVGVAAAYYVSCLAGFALRYPSSGISFLWPPNAVLLTGLLIVGYRRWPVLLAAAFAAHGIAHLQDGIPALAWSVQYFGNASQALLAAWVMRRFGAVAMHEDLRSSLVLVVGASIVAPALASVIPASIYVSLGWATDLFAAWRARTVSNAVATMSLVPALLAVWWYCVQRPALQLPRVVEFVSLLIGLAATHSVAASAGRPGLLGLSVALSAIAPFLIWATVRFGGAGLSFALSTALLMMSVAATQARPGSGAVPTDAIVGVQLLLIATAVPLFLLAGLLRQQQAERRTLTDFEHQNRAMRRALPDTQQALLEAQRRYRLALSTGGIGVWEYDLATGHVHVDGTLKAVLGYGEDEISDTLSEWQAKVFEPDREDVMARLAEVAAGTARTFEMEFRVMHRDGSLRWVSSRATVAHTADGQPARVVGTYVDITDVKAAGRALADAHDRLARVGRIAAMSELTASVAHELNQPLAAITTNVLACLRQLDSQRQRAICDALNDVLHDSRRAITIVERTQRLFGKRPAQPVRLNLNDVVREVIRLAAPRLRGLNARLQLALDPAVPAVDADDVQMQQVVFNLIANAADALQPVDVSRRFIRISTRYTRRHVVVSVRDSGAGLDPAAGARIFEPFYTTKATGTGMGLAISRSIVRGHGGALWGVANRDGGSTFRFKVPLAAGDGTAVVAHKGAVLVVDDNRALRKSLVRLLRGYGYRVAVAASGARAAALFQTFRPDAAVVDISLGDMSGLELAKHFRSVAAGQPLSLIALTAYEDEGVRQACLAAGFDDYLVKQTQISQLPVVLAHRARGRGEATGSGTSPS